MKRILFSLIISLTTIMLIYTFVKSNRGVFRGFKRNASEVNWTPENTVYDSETLKIKVEPIKKEDPPVNMWITTVKVKDTGQIKSAFARDKFPPSKKEKTSLIAQRHGAVLAVNGDACGFNSDTLVIRNGILYRESTIINSLLFDDKGLLKFDDDVRKSSEQLVEEGIIHSFLFAPPLIRDGKIETWVKDEGRDPRTGIGQRTPYEYIIIIADGRSSASRGLTLYEMAKIFEELGCHTAYNLDGGGSTTLYFKGRVINNPSDFRGERAVSDILYFID
jgi:exopolysaccharide biosynthesis protein